MNPLAAISAKFINRNPSRIIHAFSRKFGVRKL